MNANTLSRFATRKLAARASSISTTSASSAAASSRATRSVSSLSRVSTTPSPATSPTSSLSSASAPASTFSSAAAASSTTLWSSRGSCGAPGSWRRAVATAVVAATATVTIASASSEPQVPVTNEVVAAVTAAVEDLLDQDENEFLGPTLVRLAWHASGTYDKETGSGGSEGATMRFEPESSHGANAGLGVARHALEPIKKLFPQMTYSDLWTLAGAVAIEYMGGPKIVWRPGRRDAVDGTACTPDGRLPDADKGKVGETIRHVREIFVRQGFEDREIVALVGAHTLGRCYTDRSGYTGPWTRAPTTFSNLYFKELVENTWTLKQWDGPDQFEDPSGDLMMLPADMALLWDKDFRKYVVEFAKDEEAFFKSFATAFQKLEENGVAAFAGASNKPWYQFW